MKRIFALAVLLVFIVACSPKSVPDYELEDELVVETPEEPQPEQTDTQVEEPEEEKEEVGRTPPSYTPPSERHTAENQPEPEPVVPEATDPELRGVLKLADEKVKSYSFLYGGPETGGAFKHTYIIKGDNIKIQKYEEDYYISENETTHVYIDTDAETVVACCETRSRCLTPNDDYTDASYTFDYEETVADLPKTPYQWLADIPKDAKVAGHETFNQRSVVVVEFERDDGSKVHMKLDETYGLPHQVVITKGEQQVAKHQFNDLDFNSYQDDAFVPPCA